MEYDIIYADPPWRYEFSISGNRKIEIHYPTMSLEELKTMNIPAKKDSILFLWVTAPQIPAGIELMNAWGFKYCTCLVWNKMEMGMGYWIRNQHELLFIGKKGNVHPPIQSQRIGSVYEERRRSHSAKPWRILKIIKNWYPQSTILELFARNKNLGIDVWGNDPNLVSQKELII